MSDTYKTCRGCGESKPGSEFSQRQLQCKPCRNSYARAQYQAGAPGRNRDTAYAANLARNYDMDMTGYERLLRAQAYRCAICRRQESKKCRDGTPYRLAVDHDHVTGRVRGLLCHNCNQIVWALEENHTLLASINIYIETFRESLTHESE